MRGWRAILTATALTAAAPGLAATVSASRPETLADALKRAGYQVVASRDDTGDPVLDLDLAGYKARLLFFDCAEAGRDNCGSVQFFAAFDAEGAGLSAAEALGFARRHRFAAVTVNATGDPLLRWDIETGEGIPEEVFTSAAARFLGTVRAMGALLFPKVAAQ